MNKSINQIIKKCINCKYYQPNIFYDTLGICLVKKKIDGYTNHYDYAHISRSEHGHCGKDGKLFESKEK